MSSKTIDLTFERIIQATPEEAFAGWLDPKCPGTPWNIAEKLLLTPVVDGFFYWKLKGNPHYGRFTEVTPPSRLEYTWVSKNTLGDETTVTVTFQKHRDGTSMTLTHTGIPDTEGGRGHEQGWNYFLDLFRNRFASA